MDSCECAVKGDEVDSEVLIEPDLIHVKAEPVFDEPSEKSIMEENFEATDDTEGMDSSEYSMKKEREESERVMEPLFVSVKAESDFEGSSEESIKEKKLQGSEEPEGLFEEVNQLPHIECGTVPSILQISAPSHDTFLKHFRSSESGSVLVLSSKCQKPLAVASSSVSQKEASDRCLLERQGEESLAGGQEQHIYEHADGSCADSDGTGRKAQGSSSHCKSSECSVCGKSFTQGSSLCEHMRNHVGEGLFKCSECGKEFSRSGYLTSHMRSHRQEKPYICPHCEKSFADHSHLNTHMRIHTGERPYKCSMCEKSFSENSKLTVHMRSHSGQKPYRCSQCGKSFTHTSHLTVHMRIHSGEKPYKCSQCGKSFTHSTHLRRHIVDHSGRRPYKCSHCEKSFARSDTLTSHIRIHTGELPFRCTVCGKLFKSCSHLNYHKHRFHAAASSTS